MNFKSGQNKLEKSGLKKNIRTGNPDQYYSAGGADRHSSQREQLVLLKDRLHDYTTKPAKATSHVYLSATSHISLPCRKETTNT